MKIIEVQVQKQTDRGEVKTFNRFVTEEKNEDTIKELIFDKYDVKGLGEFNKFGGEVINIEISEFEGPLLELGVKGVG